MPYHKEGAYDGFDSLEEAKQHYRRCRTRKDFILSDAGVTQDDPTCVHCGKKIIDDNAPRGYRGNLAVYHPKEKRVVVLHYMCAWRNLLRAVHGLEKVI